MATVIGVTKLWCDVSGVVEVPQTIVDEALRTQILIELLMFNLRRGTAISLSTIVLNSLLVVKSVLLE